MLSPDFTAQMAQRALDRLADAGRYLTEGDTETVSECLQSAAGWLSIITDAREIARENMKD